MKKRRKVRKVGKFSLPKTTKLTLPSKPTNYNEARGFKYEGTGSNIKIIKITSESKQRNALNRKIDAIYNANQKMLEDKGIDKQTFKNRIKSIMYEKRIDKETGEFVENPRSLKETLRIVSKTTAFTSKHEQFIENLKKNTKNNKEIRDQLKLEFGDKAGRIQWSKLTYDTNAGAWVMKGTSAKIKVKKFKKGEYQGQSIIEII